MGNNSDISFISNNVSYIVNGTEPDSCLHGDPGHVPKIMFGSGVFGNILALIVLFRSFPDQKRNMFYRLVAGLTVTDLLGTTLTSPVVIAVHANDCQWIGGQIMCNYFGFMMILAGYATMLIICCMSIERVICIRHPYIYRTRSSTKHATHILLICWSLAAFISLLPFMGFGDIVLQYPYTWCFFDYYSTSPEHKAFNYFYAIVAILIILVTGCCNLTSMCTLFNHCRSQDIRHGTGEKSRKYCRSKKYRDCQMLVQIIGITLVFSTCYLPLMVKVLMDQNDLSTRNVQTDFLVIRLASVNQILDPWVYILLRRELLWKVIFGFRSCVNRNNQLNASPSQIIKYDRDDQSCCDFCFKCLCYPPVKWNPSDSMSSYYSERRISVVASSITPPDIRRAILRNMSETKRNRNVQYINNYVKSPENVTVMQTAS